VRIITGEGLKTSRRAGTFRDLRDQPSYEQFVAEVEGGEVPVCAKVKLPTQLREAAGARARVSVGGRHVGAVLESL
jgi:hypothetical protein